VIDGRKLPGGPSSHAEHLQAAVQIQRENVDGRLIGFFSTRHHGVFTHHSSNTHIHVVLPDEKLSGHVDNVTIAKEAILMLPAEGPYLKNQHGDGEFGQVSRKAGNRSGRGQG
jgi:acetolactate decarboxylase